MKLYLAGPMTGLPDWNYQTFHDAAEKLRAEGHEVFSPAEWGQASAFQRRKAFMDYTRFICGSADGIALLPGWEYSLGARAEHALAAALELKIIYLAEPVRPERTE